MLEELAAIFSCRVHAYVLMTNHVHLLLSPGSETACSSLMKNLAQRYAQHFNRKNRRTGPLWEGRFHSNLVDTETYFLRCQRYIELNPVRAGMVRHPGGYQWSSFRSNAMAMPSALITPHGVYLALAEDLDARLDAYRSLFDADPSPAEVMAIRAALRGGCALGSEKFVAEVEALLGRRAKRKAAVSTPCPA